MGPNDCVMNLGKTPIEMGPSVPRRQGPVSKWIFQQLMKAAGWKITGSIPDLNKFVLIGGPHTSNWDFVFGVLSVFSLGLDVHFIGKHTLFKPPFGWLLRKFGGIPVNRANPGTLYRDILRGFSENEAFVFGLSPEGTRSKVEKWKPGFHRIAKAANVPILPAALDFKLKTVHYGPLFWVTDDFEADVRHLKSFYAGFAAKRPELF